MQKILNNDYYFNIGGMTFQVRADLPIIERTFHNNIMKYRCSVQGQDLVGISHHFSLPSFKEVDFGPPVYKHSSWTFFHTASGWIYRENGLNVSGHLFKQLAFFNDDYSSGEIFHPDARDFQAGCLKSLTLRSTDQILFAQLLANRQGCILHASAMNIDGHGFLFLGHSGAGKSTILNLLKDDGKVIGEDRNILRCHPDGWRIYGFFHLHENFEISPAPAALRAILLLEQASENRLIPVTNRKELVSRLLPLVIKAMVTPDWWEKTLDLVEKIASEVPVYRLQFEQNDRVKELIQELL